MQIDWITVSAQIVNFLILVWLLKRFLYQPVIQVMERREQRIRDRLGEAREREEQAQEKARHYEEKTGELEERREDLLSEAQEEASEEKQRMLEDARNEADESREDWKRQAREEKEDFLKSLRQRTAEAVEAVAQKALRDLADTQLEQQIVAVFIERLKCLDKEQCEAMVDNAGTLRVSSRFELDSALRSRLTRALHEHVAADAEVEYRQSDELLCGIEVSGEGRRLGWNLADYMEGLQSRVKESFEPVETA